MKLAGHDRVMLTNSTIGVPLVLRANDIKQHLVNVDSRFRDQVHTSTAANFQFTLPSTVRNILRLRMTSIEFPSNYFFFTAKRENVYLQMRYEDPSGTFIVKEIEVPDGNYTAVVMGAALQLLMSDVSGMSVGFSSINGAFTFTANVPFRFDTRYRSKDRVVDYGLGYYIGFTRGVHNASWVAGTTPPRYQLVSDICAYFAADNYAFLKINDYGCVRQTIREYSSNPIGPPVRCDEFTAMAKLVLRQPKNFMEFDATASEILKEVVFPAPVDLSRLHVQVVDRYGDVMDLGSSEFSFTLEITEVANLSLYNTIRDSLAVQYL